MKSKIEILDEMYPQLKHPTRPPLWIMWVVLTILMAIALFSCTVQQPARAEEIPQNLWMGIISEDTSGDYQVYLIIASVVRNRLVRGMDCGLIALKRKDLKDFVAREYLYALKTKGINLQKLACKAILEVFVNGKDYACSATHYEHTKIYGVPRFWKNLKIIKVIYPNTKREISLAKRK